MNEPIEVKIKLLRAGAKIPERKTPGASGWDVFVPEWAHIYTLLEGSTLKIPLGFAIEVPPGYEAQLRPRSGLAKLGIMGAFGTIDSDYRGEVWGIVSYLCSAGDGECKAHLIHPGDRIAQMVIAPVPAVRLVLTEGPLSTTERGAGGFGSTGV